MDRSYVELRENIYYVTGTRVSLDSIVYAFLNGETPESIAQAFPALNLEHVYGAITYYLANRDQVDEYLKSARAEFEDMRQKARNANPELYRKLSKAREEQAVKL